MLFEGFKARPSFQEYDPLGGNSVVMQSVTSSSTYTVPAGKTLLIKGLNTGGTGTGFTVDGVTVLTLAASTTIVDMFKTYTNGTVMNMLTSAASTTTIYSDAPFLLPIRSGAILASTDANPVRVYGWLVDE